MPRGYKRSYSGYKKRKLNVDKKLLLNSGVLTGGTQSNISLFTASEAVILKGLRVNGAVQSGGPQGGTANSPSNVRWALLVVREGYTPNAINQGSSGDFYIPEQDVWVWGVGYTIATATPANGIYEYKFDIAPRTSRKMQEGDQLYLSIVSELTGEANINTQVFVCQ